MHLHFQAWGRFFSRLKIRQIRNVSSFVVGDFKFTSSVSLSNNRWYHLHKQIDAVNGQAQLFVDGNLQVSESFDPALGVENAIESEWIVGSGTITSTLDELRISDRTSNDWVSAVYQNQKAAPFSHNQRNNGPPSFTSAKEFVISAEKPFIHVVSATGVPSAFVGTGLPSGLLLNPADGNLSEIAFNRRCLYAHFAGSVCRRNSGISKLQYRGFGWSSGCRTFNSPIWWCFEFAGTFRSFATGGDEPIVILVDTMDQGTDFYKWKYRFDMKQALGTNSILVGGLAQINLTMCVCMRIMPLVKIGLERYFRSVPSQIVRAYLSD